MKKIIAAGAGHGALSAAINLARNGCDVTVYEKKTEEEAGHDWVDSVDLTAFDFAGIPHPPKYICEPSLQMSFTNPAKTVTLIGPEKDPEGTAVYVDRKGLLRHLIAEAKKVGVKFVFGAAVCGAVTADNDVIGIRIADGEKEKVVFADLIIDGAGVNSPVRRSLPERLGIINEISEDDMISIHRAFFDKTDNTMLDPPYAVHFYHMGRPGMDWVITKDKCVDILIGKFSPFDEGEIESALKDFREEYPFIGNELLRQHRVCKQLARLQRQLYSAALERNCHAELLPSLLSAIKTGARRIRAAEAIPPAYNEKDFAEWAQKYES